MTHYFTACLWRDRDAVVIHLRDDLHHQIHEVLGPFDAEVWLQNTPPGASPPDPPLPDPPEFCCSQPGAGPKGVIHSSL